MSDPTTAEPIIIKDTKCPITYNEYGGSSPEDNAENAVVLNERVYNKAALKRWYKARVENGDKLTDIMTGTLLPPVAPVSLWYKFIVISAGARARDLPLYIGASFILMMSQVPSIKKHAAAIQIAIFVVGIISVISRLICPSINKQNAQQLDKWIDENCKPYNPEIHMTQEQFDSQERRSASSSPVPVRS